MSSGFIQGLRADFLKRFMYLKSWLLGGRFFACLLIMIFRLSLILMLLVSFAKGKDTDDFNLSAVMQGFSEDNIFYNENFFNWGSGIVKGDDGKYLGYLNPFPDHWTQGETLEDLKDHLRDLHAIFSAEEIPGIKKEEELELA